MSYKKEIEFLKNNKFDINIISYNADKLEEQGEPETPSTTYITKNDIHKFLIEFNNERYEIILDNSKKIERYQAMEDEWVDSKTTISHTVFFKIKNIDTEETIEQQENKLNNNGKIEENLMNFVMELKKFAIKNNIGLTYEPHKNTEGSWESTYQNRGNVRFPSETIEDSEDFEYSKRFHNIQKRISDKEEKDFDQYCEFNEELEEHSKTVKDLDEDELNEKFRKLLSSQQSIGNEKELKELDLAENQIFSFIEIDRINKELDLEKEEKRNKILSFSKYLAEEDPMMYEETEEYELITIESKLEAYCFSYPNKRLELILKDFNSNLEKLNEIDNEINAIPYSLDEKCEFDNNLILEKEKIKLNVSLKRKDLEIALNEELALNEDYIIVLENKKENSILIEKLPKIIKDLEQEIMSFSEVQDFEGKKNTLNKRIERLKLETNKEEEIKELTEKFEKIKDKLIYNTELESHLKNSKNILREAKHLKTTMENNVENFIKNNFTTNIDLLICQEERFKFNREIYKNKVKCNLVPEILLNNFSNYQADDVKLKELNNVLIKSNNPEELLNKLERYSGEAQSEMIFALSKNKDLMNGYTKKDITEDLRKPLSIKR